MKKKFGAKRNETRNANRTPRTPAQRTRKAKRARTAARILGNETNGKNTMGLIANQELKDAIDRARSSLTAIEFEFMGTDGDLDNAQVIHGNLERATNEILNQIEIEREQA